MMMNNNKLSKQKQHQHQSSHHSKRYKSTISLTCHIAVGVPSAFRAKVEAHHTTSRPAGSPSYRSTSHISEASRSNRPFPS